MNRRLLSLVLLSLVFSLIASAAAWADGPGSLDLPPGIEAQAEPLIELLMSRMQADCPHHDPAMMVQHLQTLADRLEPGVFLQVLRLLVQLETPDLMVVCHELHHGGLLDQPPGVILAFVLKVAR